MIRRMWSWIRSQFGQASAQQDRVVVRSADYPELLELWFLAPGMPPDSLPTCLTLVSSRQRGHDAANANGPGVYSLWTRAGVEMGTWSVQPMDFPIGEMAPAAVQLSA